MENTEIMSTTSDSVNEIMESGNTMLQNAEGSLDSLNECLQSIQVLTENVCSSVTAWKEIDKEMLAMDLHFRAFEKEMDTNLEAYKSRLPIIEKQLDAVNMNLGKILDAVLMMDVQTESQIEMKMKMMDRIDLFLNTICHHILNTRSVILDNKISRGFIFGGKSVNISVGNSCNPNISHFKRWQNFYNLDTLLVRS